MDNIAIEAYALCCLLPLIAFLLLAAQFYRHAPAKARPLFARTLQEEFPSSFEGLISISSLYKHQANTNPCSTLTSDDTSSVCNKSKDENEHQIQRHVKRQIASSRDSFLAGCVAGLAKMKLINRVYFKTSLQGKKHKFDKKTRPRKEGGNKEKFERTRLATIIQGLQY